MRRFFSLDGGLYKFLDKCWQLLVANFLFLIGSLPIISLGASLVALDDSILAIERDEFRPRRFWKVWKSRFGIGTGLLGIVVVVLIMIGMPVVLLRKGGVSFLAQLPFMVLFALLLLVSPTAFAVTAWSPSAPDLWTTVRVSFVQAIAHTGLAILSALAPLVIAVLIVFFWRLLPLWCCFCFSLAAWMQRPVLRRLLGENSNSSQ